MLEASSGPSGSLFLCWCLMSQQHASVPQGQIYSDKFTCCHTEREVAHPTFYLIQSQYTDTGPTSPSADPITANCQTEHRLIVKQPRLTLTVT